MMGTQGKIMLCADTESIMRPWMMGLDGIDVESFDWLVSLSSADEARRSIASMTDIDEAWVVSSNDIESLNLAAAIRKDNPELPIDLILSKLSGSILSRASSAGIKTIYTTFEFAERFALEVQRRRRMEDAESLGYDDVITTIRKNSSKRRKLDVPEVTTSKSASVASISSGTSVGSSSSPTQEITLKAEQRTGHCPDGRIVANEARLERTPSRTEDANAFIMGLFSGSGGVGKSVACVLLAFICARQHQKVLLVDADLQFGDLSTIIGRKDAPTIDDVLEDPAIIEGESLKAKEGTPSLIAAPKRPENSDDIDKHLGEIIAECAKHFDAIFVNTGSYWREGHVQLLETCDCSLFLMDQRASSVRSLNRALDLCKRMGVATNAFSYALNHCDKKALFMPLDIAGVMNGAHIYELKDGGIDIEESCGAGCADELLDAGNPFVSSLASMLADIRPGKMGSSTLFFDHGSKRSRSDQDRTDGSAVEVASKPSLFRKKRSGRRRTRGREMKRADDVLVPRALRTEVSFK